MIAGPGRGPVQPPGKMPQVARGLPGMGEVAERGREDPTLPLGEAPREGVAPSLHPFLSTAQCPRGALRVPTRPVWPRAGCARVGDREVAEEVDLVVPGEGRSEMGDRGMGRLEHVDGERTGPRMAGEPAADQQPVVVPTVAGVGR